MSRTTTVDDCIQFLTLLKQNKLSNQEFYERYNSGWLKDLLRTDVDKSRLQNPNARAIHRINLGLVPPPSILFLGNVMLPKRSISLTKRVQEISKREDVSTYGFEKTNASEQPLNWEGDWSLHAISWAAPNKVTTDDIKATVSIYFPHLRVASPEHVLAAVGQYITLPLPLVTLGAGVPDLDGKPCSIYVSGQHGNSVKPASLDVTAFPTTSDWHREHNFLLAGPPK